MRTAIYPGTFDPITLGHIDVIKKSLKIVDKLIVATTNNSNKRYFFSIEERLSIIKNSLFKDQSDVKQDTIKNFKKKISVAKKISSKDFMVIARIESFILGKGLNDAIKRAEEYSKAGADAILIHSKDKSINNLTQFAKKFSNSKFYKPLVCVPSAYPQVKENELSKIGFKIVIYANHLLRTSYKSMKEVALEILTNQRAFNSRKKMSTIKEVISLIK